MVIPTKSGVLLALSCIAAIACVGCVFELSSGHPTYGATITMGILALSAPVGLWSFIEAAKAAKAGQS
jgi:hypothetical protein